MRRKNAACYFRHHPEQVLLVYESCWVTRSMNDPTKYDMRSRRSGKVLYRFDEHGEYHSPNQTQPKPTRQDIERWAERFVTWMNDPKRSRLWDDPEYFRSLSDAEVVELLTD